MIANKKIIKTPTFNDVLIERGNEWNEVITFARQLLGDKLLSDRNLIKLCLGQAAINETMTVLKLFYYDSKERPTGASAVEIFFRVIDNSIYSLAAWIEAVHFFNNWLEENDRKTTFQKMLGYLQCCEESPENKEITFRFIDLVDDMLKEHGYVG